MSHRFSDGLIEGPDGKVRCWWHGNDPEYMRYHDEEWGHPIDDDQRLFEKISLEGFQAGLSWLTILRKRENFREAFDDFDYKKIQQYNEKKIEALLQNAGIIRHRGKIEAVINNAQQMNELLEEYSSFAAYIWSFEPSDEERPKKFDYATLSKITQSEASKKTIERFKEAWLEICRPDDMLCLYAIDGDCE